MILPPIPTPFDREGRLDTGAFRALAEALEPLVDGLLVYGSNGEGVHLTPEERARGLRALRPRKPFLVGLMEETLAQAEGALEEAKAAGAMALLATPPRYYHGSLGEGLLRYYQALAERMPLFLYHVPQNTKVDLPLEAVETLARHPRIQGVKDSSGDLSRIAFYQARLRDFRVYTGHAPTFLGALALGSGRGDPGGGQPRPPGLPRPSGTLPLRAASGGPGPAKEALSPRGPPGQRGRAPPQAGPPVPGPARGLPQTPLPGGKPLWERFLPVLEGLKEEGWVL